MKQAPRLPVSTRRLLFGLIVLGTLGTVVGGNTISSFTDNAQSASNTFATGSVYMTNGTSCTGGDCGTLSLAANANMIRGDTATGTLTMTNSGTLPATFVLTFPTVSGGTSMNVKIHDDTTDTCVFGKVDMSKVGGGANTYTPTIGNTVNNNTHRCDDLSTTTLDTSLLLSNMGSLSITIPGNGSGNKWAGCSSSCSVFESHSFNVTIVLPTDQSPSVSNTSSIDFRWTATS